MARARTRRIKVHTVDLDVDETSAHYLVFVSPHIEAQALGIGSHRARLPKCRCPREVGAVAGSGFSGRSSRCRICGGWSAEGMARHVGKLLRSYPKKTVRVVDTSPVRRRRQVHQEAVSFPVAVA